MDNSADQLKNHPRLHAFMQQHGITDTRGIELLRALRIVNSLYDGIFSERLRENQLSGPRWGLLMRLYIEEVSGNMSGLSPSQLSHYQHVSKNTVSALLRGLEEQGLIARQLDPNDRRSFTIHLTDLARTQIRENAPQHVAFLNQLCAGLSPDESSILLSLLAKLRQSLLQYTAVDDCHTVNSAPSVSVHAGSMRS